MKINGWIILGSIVTAAGFSQALGATQPTAPQPQASHLEQLQTLLQRLKNGESGNIGTDFRWMELDQFQSKLWKAMALDPGPGPNVPVNQVPKELFAAALTENLIENWNGIKNSQIPKDYRAQFEFEIYSAAVDQILKQRQVRAFPTARAVAKQGVLDHAFDALTRRLAQNADPNAKMGGRFLSSAQILVAENLIQGIKTENENSIKIATQSAQSTHEKNPFFAKEGNLTWMFLTMVVGFVLGIIVNRVNPATADQKRKRALRTFDYFRWLGNFENSLVRLRNGQKHQEKQIEILVNHSASIRKQAIELHGDARVRADANLEHRMHQLVEEIHAQINTAHQIQASERAQIGSMLEQCLMLCDAVESESVDLTPRTVKRSGPTQPFRGPSART